MLKSVVSRILIAVVGGAVLLSPFAVRAQSSEPVQIDVILSQTGQSAFLGHAEQEALTLVEQVVNAKGGVRGRAVHFAFADDASTPQTGVSLMNGLIAKGVQVVLGPSGTNVCEAVFPIVQAAERVSYCFSPAVRHLKSYMFSANIDVADLAAVSLRYARARGWTRLGVLVTTDAAGRSFEDAYRDVAALRQYAPVRTVLVEHMGPADVSAAAQVARIKAAGVQAVIAWSVGPPTGTILRNIADAGLDLPIIASSANMTYVQMSQYASFLPKELYFPNAASVNYDPAAPAPVRSVQQQYFQSFARAKLQTDSATSLAWDPALIIVDALNRLGPNATGKQVQEYIETLHGWPGINGYYDFRDGRQRGLLMNAALMEKWDPAKADFIPVSKAGGSL